MGPRKRKKKRQAGRQSSHFPRKCVQQTCRNTPPSESFNCPSLLTLVASAQLQELSLSSQGRLWFPTTRQPAYFILWVQPHHGRSNGNESLRVIALRAITAKFSVRYISASGHSLTSQQPYKLPLYMLK
jgi:hypothetical protein